MVPLFGWGDPLNKIHKECSEAVKDLHESDIDLLKECAKDMPKLISSCEKIVRANKFQDKKEYLAAAVETSIVYSTLLLRSTDDELQAVKNRFNPVSGVKRNKLLESSIKHAKEGLEVVDHLNSFIKEAKGAGVERPIKQPFKEDLTYIEDQLNRKLKSAKNAKQSVLARHPTT